MPASIHSECDIITWGFFLSWWKCPKIICRDGSTPVNILKTIDDLLQVGQWYQFSSVQSFSRVWLFVTPWIAARQASLSITNSRSSLRLMSIESVMPSSHLILCRPLLLLPPIPPSIRIFSKESALHMRWPKYWSFSFSISQRTGRGAYRQPASQGRSSHRRSGTGLGSRAGPGTWKVLERTPRADLLQNGLVGSPCSPRDSQESSPAPQFKSINSSVLSFLDIVTHNTGTFCPHKAVTKKDS